MRGGVALEAAGQLQSTSKQAPCGHCPAMTLAARRLKIDLLVQAGAMIACVQHSVPIDACPRQHLTLALLRNLRVSPNAGP